MPVYLESNAADVMRRFRAMPVAIRTNIVREMRKELTVVEGEVIDNAATLKFRRGGAGLAGRLTSYAKPDAALGLDAAIGFRKSQGFPYELSQEFGAKAKSGKAMAIPVSPIAKRLSERGIGPRQSGLNLFLPHGTHVLAGRTSYRAKLNVHYVLVKSIPARLNFMKTVVHAFPRFGAALVRGAATAVSEGGTK